MKILYTCDDNYIFIMGISMISLFESNKETSNIEIYLLGERISEQNKKIIRDLAEKYNRQVHLIDSPHIDLDLDYMHFQRWPLSAYIRLFSAEILPDSIDRILYLDCDTIINGDIGTLDSIDISQKLFYGVKDCVSASYKNNIGISISDGYVNAGVLLINLKKLRKVNIKKKTEEFLKKYGGFITYADQDILNGLFHNQIGILSPEYNVMTISTVYNYKEICLLRRPSNYYSEKEIKAAFEDPKIIHFTTNMRIIRPWYRNSNHPYAQLFENYKKLSPWANKPLSEMNFSGKNLLLIGLIEKLPNQLSYSILGFVHAFVRPMCIRFRAKLSKGRK